MNDKQQFYYKNNRLQQLRGFYFAVQLGGVSKAAEHMMLVQSTVSMQIKSLERDLEVKLFDRNGPNLSLTEDGKALYKMVRPLIEGMDNLYDNFVHEKNISQNVKFDIAANQISSTYLLPKAINQLLDYNPNIQVTIHEMPTSEAFEKLYAEELDLIVGSFISVPDTLEYIPFLSCETVLVLRKDHPLNEINNISLDDIAKYNLVRIAPHLITVPLFEEMLKQFNITSNIHFTEGDWIILKEFVRAEAGIAIISDICMQGNDPDLTTKSLNHYFPNLTYGAVIKRGKKPSLPVEQFLQILVDKYNLLEK